MNQKARLIAALRGPMTVLTRAEIRAYFILAAAPLFTHRDRVYYAGSHTMRLRVTASQLADPTWRLWASMAALDELALIESSRSGKLAIHCVVLNPEPCRPRTGEPYHVACWDGALVET